VSGGGRGRQSHWDAAYRDRGLEGVSWYQARPALSLELIRRLGLGPGAAVLDVGGGASGLAEALVADGLSDVTVLDVSAVALDALRRRLGPASPVRLVHADLLDWEPERTYDLWHDRAVFHFLVDPAERRRYLQRLDRAVAPAGAVVVGTFAPDGPERCSGLPVARYAPEDLARALGPGFEVVDRRREEHLTPAGALQAFTWVAARRVPIGT
jgi:SAM-dependent methyltransferase